MCLYMYNIDIKISILHFALVLYALKIYTITHLICTECLLYTYHYLIVNFMLHVYCTF